MIRTPRTNETNNGVRAARDAEYCEIACVDVMRDYQKYPAGYFSFSTFGEDQRNYMWTHKYPIALSKQEPQMCGPRLWTWSDHIEMRMSKTAAAAYGGTVSNCASAFAANSGRMSDR